MEGKGEFRWKDTSNNQTMSNHNLQIDNNRIYAG